MRLDRNNNHHIIYRIAKSNLQGKKLSSCFSFLSILLAIVLVSTLVLFLVGTQTSKQKVIDKMQHTMFMNVTSEQMMNIAADSDTELMVPYKHNETEFQIKSVKYNFYYFESHAYKIKTYIPVEGRTPENYNEIVVDKAFMDALGEESKLGTSIFLDINGEAQEFVICGFTDDKYSALTHPIRVSKVFADECAIMRNIPYTALVRINSTSDLTAATFETIVYQMAADYGIERADVNINGKFEESLNAGNANLYTVLFASILIAAASALVIYSIFYLSIASRVQQIGQLQTIGMTQRQIRKMVRIEGLLLSLFALPIGLILSGIIAYFIQPDGWDFENYGIVSLLIAAFGTIIVQISIGKPASIAAKISPIEASRNTTGEKEKEHYGRRKKLNPCTLARMEVAKNQKKWWLTTASLALGGLVFVVASSYSLSWNEDAYSRQSLFAQGEYYISYLYNHSDPKPYGITEMQLTGHLDKELEEKILQIPNVKKIHIENEVMGNIEYKGTAFLQSFYPLTEDSAEYFDISAEGNNTYSYLAENDAILIVNSDFCKEVYGVNFKQGDTITFHYYDGEERSIELIIGAVSTEIAASNTERSNFCIADSTMRKLWGAMNTASSFTISINEYEKNGEYVEESIRTILQDYEDLSLWTLREQKFEDAGAVQTVKIQIYGLSAFIIVFSLFNLINTIISSIATRKKELSMLESIGMEEKQIRNMLFWENIFIVFPNILITLTVGTAAGYCFVSCMGKIAPYLEFRLPVIALIIYTAGMIIVPILISFVCLKEMNRASLIERVRVVD